MDYNDDKGTCDWYKKDCSLQRTSNYAEEMWNHVPQNEDDVSYMFDDDTTPVKACGDLAYHVNDSDNIQKEQEECRETPSQAKRRRMLQFHENQEMELSLSNEGASSAYLKANEEEESLENIFPEISQWMSGISGNLSTSGYEDLEQSSEGWFAECFNDDEMHFSPDDMNFSGADNVQIDVAETSDVPTDCGTNVAQQNISQAPRKIIFKGRKSLIRTPTKLASSVAYPFAFIKPSGAHGDVTLKEINQRIRTPPPSKSKQNEEVSASLPKSAFSGKPVVGKTKIRTEGGKVANVANYEPLDSEKMIAPRGK